MDRNWHDLINRQKKRALRSSGRIERSQAALQKLKDLIIENEQEFLNALHSDLGKSQVESYASEIAVTLNEIDFLLKNQRRLLKHKRIMSRPGTQAYVSLQPYGSVLIMSPWNYPFQLALLPLAGAIATGNSCFLKPSELAPATSCLINKLISSVYTPEEITVAEGDGQVAAALLEQDWDFIFFTGSERIGSIVAETAARLRIPSILELGGKCPCIVDADSVNEATARKIVWGKFFNTGQTCVAPDYILVEAKAATALLAEMKKQINRLYGDDPSTASDYGKIIGIKHFNRLTAMLLDAKIYTGGNYQKDKLYIEPTIIIEAKPDSKILQEEIFGPLLPVTTWTNQDELIRELQTKPAPLAVYAFCQDRLLISKLQNRIRSGAFCLNNVLEHVARLELPFGGVGNSGYGRYHGKSSIDAFTWQKTIYKTRRKIDLGFKYPPYNTKHLRIIRLLRRWLP